MRHALKNKESLSKFFALFLISFLSLFLELAIIRWTPGIIASVSYFTNIAVIASFFGLGLGCAVSRKNVSLLSIPISFVVLVSVAVFLSRVGVSSSISVSDFIFISDSAGAFPMSLAIPIVFFAICFVFFGMGVLLGRCFGFFSPLVSYSVNVAASILGVAVFTFLSFKSFPPALWFLIGFLGLYWFIRKHKLYAGLCFISCLILIASYSSHQIWSPYYKLEIRFPRVFAGEFFRLTVNNDYQQLALDFSPRTVEAYQSSKHWRDIYNFPYLFTAPKKVLIVGSGVGNDVLLAVENKVARIDAVEIDPRIISMGKQLRPDNPYGDAAVRTFVDDARSYMNRSKEKYDLIVYGFLDSHALFANMPSVRLDNFVYTVEGIERAKQLLSGNGTVALSFYVGRPWVGNKIYYMLKEVFGKRPLVYMSTMLVTEQIFIVSLDDSKMVSRDVQGFAEISDTYAHAEKLPLPVDNWPYFYLERHSIPFLYLNVLTAIFFFSVLTILLFLPSLKNMPRYLTFFLLGAAFMLLEARSIVHLSLLFGTTWLVNSAVITGILLMILCANLYVNKCKPRKIRVFYAALLLSLILNFFIHPKDIGFAYPAFEIALRVAFVSLPLLFAGIIFALLFKDTQDVKLAFGMNIIGAVLGGLLEYSSLIIGLNNLLLFAIALYTLSYIAYRKLA